MGGDCDTVGSIAGQIAGAMYGIDRDMLKLYSQMDDFLYGRYEVFLVAYKLVNRVPIDIKKNKIEENKMNRIEVQRTEEEKK